MIEEGSCSESTDLDKSQNLDGEGTMESGSVLSIKDVMGLRGKLLVLEKEKRELNVRQNRVEKDIQAVKRAMQLMEV